MVQLPSKDQKEAIEAVLLHNNKKREEGKGPLAFIVTFDCQQNEADSEKMRGLCDAMGYGRAKTPEESDLILVNTCAIRQHAELKALSTIGRYKHIKTKNPSLIIGVCGCMTAEEHRVDESKHRYPYVDFTTPPSAIGRIPALLDAVLRCRHRYFLLNEQSNALEGLPIARTVPHRAWVSIMYGCNNFCSYCIVPYVRGRERSRARASIVNEVKALLAGGAKEITLLGQNVNSYKSDVDFPTLLEELDGLEGEFILRFMTSHPKDVSSRLIEVVAKGKHIEPHFHLPLQSGSDRILKEMNRHYDKKRYLSVASALKQAKPDIVLTSDIIVGFPGETEEDFEETLSVVRQVEFDSVFSFIYSPRKGTPAAKMEEQVPPHIQSERFARLVALQNDIGKEKNMLYEGRAVRVLVDGLSKNDPEIYSGRTDGGKLVHLRATRDDIGQFVTVHIERAATFELFGTIVK